MRPEIQQTITDLSNLDLATYPYDQTVKLIGQLGKFGCIQVTLHKDKTIMRARPNLNGETFNSKYQLTYKPQQLNKTYQRASTPNMTMFYATLIPEKLEEGELDNLRVVGVFESLPWLRDKKSTGIQKISFGRWLVTKDINLIAVVQHQDYYKASSYTRELVDTFKNFTKQYPELEDETTLISDFFAKQFAKEEINHDYDYLISAAFSEMIVGKGIDGVMYPSVRTQGQGFNVAIKPYVADNCLDLIVAGECSIYKYFEESMVDNENIAELTPNQTNFEMKPVEAKYHAGEAECLRRLGLKSLNELTRR